MKRALALALIVLLSACREETAALPAAVPMTAESVGYYCQMNVLEHPGPKGQIHLDGLPGAPLFFSQVRDVVAYLRMPEQSHTVLATYVSDIGAAPSWDQPGADNWVLLDKVVFVVGSDMMGGMGLPELAPFTDPAKAQAFAAAHGGTVMTLAEIPDAAVRQSDAPEVADGTDGDADYKARLLNLKSNSGG